MSIYDGNAVGFNFPNLVDVCEKQAVTSYLSNLKLYEKSVGEKLKLKPTASSIW